MNEITIYDLIPCNEKLPEIGQRVLGLYDYSTCGVSTCYFMLVCLGRDGYWTEGCTWHPPESITHWMTLPKIPTDFGEDTIALWHEIESRLKQPECLTFDKEKAYEMLNEEINKQYGIIQQNEVATLSYHAGIESGLRLAKSIIKECMKREG